MIWQNVLSKESSKRIIYICNYRSMFHVSLSDQLAPTVDNEVELQCDVSTLYINTM